MDADEDFQRLLIYHTIDKDIKENIQNSNEAANKISSHYTDPSLDEKRKNCINDSLLICCSRLTSSQDGCNYVRNLLNSLQRTLPFVNIQNHFTENHPNSGGRYDCNPFLPYGSVSETKDNIQSAASTFNPLEKNKSLELLIYKKCEYCIQEDFTHYIAVAHDFNPGMFPVQYYCYFCRCHEEEGDGVEVDDEQKVPFSGKGSYGSDPDEIDLTESYLNLTPLTLNILRAQTGEKDLKAVKRIGKLLSLSENQVYNFINDCRNQIKTLIGQDQFNFSSHDEFRYTFATALDLILPVVWDKYKPQYFCPSLPNLFTLFMIHPSYRYRAPVMFAFLRLHTRLSSEYYTKASEVVNLSEKGFNINEEEEEEINEINIKITDTSESALNYLKSMYLPKKTRDALDDFQGFPYTIKSYDEFVPYLVINYYAEAHNEFTRILSRHSNIRPDSINSNKMNPGDVRLPVKEMEDHFYNSLITRMDRNGNIQNIEDAESAFIASISSYHYTLIIVESASLSSVPLPPVPAEKLTTIFSKKDFITPKALTSEHRSKLIKYIIKPGHSVGFSFLLERVMQESLTIGQRRELTEMINSITGKLTAIEAAAADAFAITRTKCNADFTIDHVLSMYQLVNSNNIEDLIRTTNFNIYYKIYSQFKAKFHDDESYEVEFDLRKFSSNSMCNTVAKIMKFALTHNFDAEESLFTQLKQISDQNPSELNQLLSREEKADFENILKFLNDIQSEAQTDVKFFPIRFLKDVFKSCFNQLF